MYSNKDFFFFFKDIMYSKVRCIISGTFHLFPFIAHPYYKTLPSEYYTAMPNVQYQSVREGASPS